MDMKQIVEVFGSQVAVARAFGVTRGAVWQWVRAGTLPEARIWQWRAGLAEGGAQWPTMPKTAENR